jgi:membrane protein DedA with SNARE-associated domain
MAGPLRLSSTISTVSLERGNAEAAHIQLSACIASIGTGGDAIDAGPGPAQIVEFAGTTWAEKRCPCVDTLNWLLDLFPFTAWLLDSEWLLGLLLFALTVTVMSLGVPGVLVPISFSSGALLGGWEGMAVVGIGALLGSQAFFVVARRWLAARIRRRWDARLKRFDSEIARRGFFYLLGLRLVGVPHLPLTAASALSPIRARSFALASLIGFLPAIGLAAMAGSAV